MERPQFHPGRVVAWSSVLAVGLGTTALLPEAVTVFLVGFLGVVLAAVLSGMGAWIERHTGLGRRLSVTAVLLAFALLIAGLVVWTVFVTGPEVARFAGRIPSAMENLEGLLRRLGLGSVVSAFESPLEALIRSEALRARVLGVFSNGLAAVVSFFVVLFIGIYGALQADIYVAGAIRLFPLERRARMERVGHRVIADLQRWLAGVSISAAFIGISTGLAVWALDVPLPLSIGLLAGLLSYIPNVGPILTVIPAGLLALTVSPFTALAVVGIYSGVQLLESYLLSPLVQERAVRVPPGLLLFAQVLLGILFGLLGVALAAPLLAVLIVLVRELYIVDRLEEGGPKASSPHELERAPVEGAPADGVPAQ